MQEIVDALPTNTGELLSAILTAIVSALLGWLKGRNSGRRDRSAIER